MFKINIRHLSTHQMLKKAHFQHLYCNSDIYWCWFKPGGGAYIYTYFQPQINVLNVIVCCFQVKVLGTPKFFSFCQCFDRWNKSYGGISPFARGGIVWFVSQFATQETPIMNQLFAFAFVGTKIFPGSAYT